MAKDKPNIVVKDESTAEPRLTTAELFERIARLPPEEQARAKRALVLHYKPSTTIKRTPEAAELESYGWETWLGELAPHVFKGSHAKFHREFWDWYWPLLLAKRDGHRLVNLQVPLAYLLTFARGLGKSTSVEWATIAMGALLGRVLVLYVSSTAKQAQNHLNNIREEIEDAFISKYYPGLANPMVGEHDNRYGWNQTNLASDSGLLVFALGLQEEARGLKRRQLRPGLIILDEFDSKDDSPDVVAKKEKIIGGSIFGTQTGDTLILMAQNLIHGQSVATRTFKRRNQLLADRKESGLIKAFTDDLEIEMDGSGKWKVTRGQPIWNHFNREDFQKFLNTSGPIEVFAEYQHQFDHDKTGRVFRNYRDKDALGFSHVITEEQFASVYGYLLPPPAWNKYVFHDVARTKTELHANIAGTLSVSNQNTALPGITFLYNCLAFPEDTPPDDCALEMLKLIAPRIRIEGIDYDWNDLLRVLIAREGIGHFTGNIKDQIDAQRALLARIIPKYVRPLLTSQRYMRFRMSHEKDDWKRVYREVFGLPFEPAAPPDGAGIELINLAMKVDGTIPDPFRPGQMGFSRFYIIVKKNHIHFPNDNKPDELFGSDLARYQLTEHRWLSAKLNALGELERGQEKKNDDFPNGLQMFYMDHSIMARELTREEMEEQMMAPALQLATIEAETDPEKKEKAVYARELSLRRTAMAKLAKQLALDNMGGRGGSRLASYRRLYRRGR